MNGFPCNAIRCCKLFFTYVNGCVAAASTTPLSAPTTAVSVSDNRSKTSFSSILSEDGAAADDHSLQQTPRQAPNTTTYLVRWVRTSLSSLTFAAAEGIADLPS